MSTTPENCPGHEFGIHADVNGRLSRRCRLCGYEGAPPAVGLDIAVVPGQAQPGLSTPIGFAAEQEPMAIYQLEDGSLIKVKVVLMHVERLEGQYLPDGTPMYNCAFQQVLHVHAPPELRRKP